MAGIDALSLLVRDEWKLEAACLGMGSEHFFLDVNDSSYEEKLSFAKSICQKCPVSKECEEAGSTEEFGIWNGEPKETWMLNE